MWLWSLRLNAKELTHAKVGGQPSHSFYTATDSISVYDARFASSLVSAQS